MNVMSGFGDRSAKSLTIRLLMDTAMASKSLDSFMQKIKRSVAVPAKEMVGASSASGAAAGLSGMIGPLGLFTGALITLYQGVKAVFKLGNIVEQARIQFELFTGSQKKALELVKGAREFSRKTSYQPQEVVSAAGAAVRYGITDPFKKGAYKLPENKTAMDVFGALGSFTNARGEEIGLDQAVLAIGRGERRVLRQYGLDVQAAHVKSLEKGLAGSQRYISSMLEELGKMPAIMNMMEMKQNSMAGLWSTITGYIEEAIMDFTGAGEEGGLTFWGEIKSILMEIRDAGESVMTTLKPLFVEFGGLIGIVLRALWEKFKFFRIWLIPVFKVAVPILRGLIIILSGVFQVIAKVLEGAIKVVTMIFDRIGQEKKLGNIINVLNQWVTGLQVSMNLFMIYFGGLIDWCVKKVEQFLNYLPDFMKGAEKYAQGLPIIGGGLTTEQISKLNKANEEDVIQRKAEQTREIEERYLGVIKKEDEGPLRERAVPGGVVNLDNSKNIVNYVNTVTKGDLHNLTGQGSDFDPLTVHKQKLIYGTE